MRYIIIKDKVICYLVYRMCRLVEYNMSDIRLRNHTNKYQTGLGYPHISSENKKFAPSFTANNTFLVLNISSLKQQQLMCLRCVYVWGGGVQYVEYLVGQT